VHRGTEDGRRVMRITTNLIPKSVTAMTRIRAVTDLNATDVINRSVQLYDYVLSVTEAGGDLLIREPGGEPQKVILL
jgi:hypothetical protein